MKLRRIVLSAVGTSVILFAQAQTIRFGEANLSVEADFHVSGAYGTWEISHPGRGRLQVLTFSIKPSPGLKWTSLTLRFDVGAYCKGKPSQWPILVNVENNGQPVIEGRRLVAFISAPEGYGRDAILPLEKDVSTCEIELVRATLISAKDGAGATISGTELATPDLTTQIEARRLQREAGRTREAEERAKREAQDADREKKEAAEQRKRDAEAQTRRAEQNAKNAAALQRAREDCRIVYKNTIDKRVTDLTVREADLVKNCQLIGMYNEH